MSGDETQRQTGLQKQSFLTNSMALASDRNLLRVSRASRAPRRTCMATDARSGAPLVFAARASPTDANRTTQISNPVEEPRPPCPKKVSSPDPPDNSLPMDPVFDLVESYNVAEKNKKMMAKSKTMSIKTTMSADGSDAGSGRMFPALVRLVRSPKFDHFVAVLLISNAVFIGYQVDSAFSNDPPVIIEYIDLIYCILFLMELVMRMYAFQIRSFFCDPDNCRWNIVDFFIVIMASIDTVIAAVSKGGRSPFESIMIILIVRLVRITRVLKVVRVMRLFKHLRVLIAAIGNTLKAACWAVVLLCMILYIFGIAITQSVADHVGAKRNVEDPIQDDDPLLHYFGSLLKGILTLFMSVCGGIDWEEASGPLLEISWLIAALFICYIIFVTLCVLNVMTGIFCESAIQAAQSDRDNLIQYQLEDTQKYVKELTSIFKQWDTSGDADISLEEFEEHLRDESIQNVFKALEIDTRDAWDFFKLLDEDGEGTVNLDEFIKGCIRLRGVAKAIHLANMEYQSKWLFDNVGQIANDLLHLKGQLKISMSDSRSTDRLTALPCVPSHVVQPSETSWTLRFASLAEVQDVPLPDHVLNLNSPSDEGGLS